jgi:hypothetical protein
VYCCRCHDWVKNRSNCEICGGPLERAWLSPEMQEAARKARDRLDRFTTAAEGLFPNGLDGGLINNESDPDHELSGSAGA